MGGSIGLLMQIGVSGLKNHQYGVDVTAHNIANVHTDGYSRQSAETVARQGVKTGGLVFGQGIYTGEIKRNVDDIVNKRLDEHRSTLAKFTELETAMTTLEGFFSETGTSSETSLSSLMSEFENAWQSVANNPSGEAERATLMEQSKSLAEAYRNMDEYFNTFQIDLTRTIANGVNEVNMITRELAKINKKIYGLEADSVIANDMRDKRDVLLTDLYELMNVSTYTQENGFITVTTAKGAILVNGTDSYDLEAEGDPDTGMSVINWLTSGTRKREITDGITEGALGGWIEMRDTIIGYPEKNGIRGDYNKLAKDFIWSINRQHAQGSGIELFPPSFTLVGTYYTTDDDASMASLPYGNKLYFGVPQQGDTPAIPASFDMWLGDSEGENIKRVNIQMITAGSVGEDEVQLLTIEDTPGDLADSINRQVAVALGMADDEEQVYAEFAQVPDFEQMSEEELAELTEEELEILQSLPESALTLKFASDETFTYGFSNDNSNVLAALGLNTYFKGHTSGTLKVNDVVDDNINYIAVGRITDRKDTTYNVSPSIQMTDLGTTGILETNGPYTGNDNALYEIKVEASANKNDVQFKWRKSLDQGQTWVQGDWSEISDVFSGANPITIENGVTLTFKQGLAAAGDSDPDLIDFIQDETYRIEATAGGVISYSSNANAFAITGLIEPIQEDYHNQLTIIGIQSLGISREKGIIDVSTDQLNEVRDNISGVSLDQEFTKLVEYQRYYQAAAKVVQTADELMKTVTTLKS
ncbi:MAG: flagellar hook-associated protein 1 FlgK [Candidatus Magnetoglobus multicellularis str. Araruama]|uniref:Flagellar hook-associated protein 1 n=1 Tax=Candidatus Magnetoglobus multicellularis str. Araruama TaxID=890399 RepID=A0A1V1P337_9BACT|nr:MAG: flagellar hook-associated protein 1 FlgK [Candidatus Magnetoglobus multicellularis str. Araruama]